MSNSNSNSFNHLHSDKLWNRNFLAVCMSSFFLFMGFYIYVVALPIFVTDALHGTQGQIGLATTAFVFAAVAFRPLAGRWADTGNRKKVLLVGLALFFASTCMYPFINSYSLLIVLRLIHGVGFGIAATLTGAIAADLIPIQRKGEGLGYFSLFMSLAMVIGPFVGLSIIEAFSSTVMFMVCILLSACSLVAGLIVTPAPRTPIPDSHKQAAEEGKGWRAFIEPGAVPIAVTAALFAFAYAGITTFISIYAKELGLSAYASFFFMAFALLIVLPRPFTGKLFDRKGANVLVYPGLILFTAGLFLLSMIGSGSMLLITAGIVGLGYGAVLPSYQTIAVQSSPAHRTGLATATYFMFFDTGFGVGSSVLGVVASKTGYAYMYVLSAIVVAVSILLYYMTNHRRQAKKVAVNQQQTA